MPDHSILTTLPLSPELLGSFFKDKTTRFTVDYQSALLNLKTDRAILTYIANLGLIVDRFENCDISPTLVQEFIHSRDFCDIRQLREIHANILYFCKYNEIVFEDAFASFDYDKIVDYVRSYSESVIIQTAFLNSLPLYTALSTEPSTSAREQNNLSVHVDDTIYSCITRNFLGVFKLDDFTLQFLESAPPINDQIYFKAHCERKMYQGHNLFKWYAIPENSYFLFVKHITDSLDTATARLSLIDLYAQLAAGLGQQDEIDSLNAAINADGGLMQFIGASRKDIAKLNREAKKAKKAKKRQR